MSQAVPTYTLPMYQAGLSPAWDLEPAGSLTIRVVEPSAIHPRMDEFPIQVDGRGRLDVWTAPQFGRYLATLDGLQRVELHGTNGPEPLRFSLAGPWCLDPVGHRVSWAGRVVPNDRTVAAWIRGLGHWRREFETVAARFYGETTDALVSQLLERLLEVDWTVVPDEEMGATTLRAQPPHHMFVLPDLQAGQSTGVELGLLLASGLEALGAAPILLVSHSGLLVAWKRVRSRGFRPVLDNAVELRDLVDREVWGVVDPNRILARKESRLDSLGAFSGFGVDCRAARPQDGSVAPLELARDPGVERGVLWAETRPAAKPRAETIHLFSGLIHAGAQTVIDILEGAGGDPRSWASAFDPPEAIVVGAGGPVRRTINYKVTLEHAQDIAQALNSPSVRESDLVWALLESASRRVHYELEAMGCDRSEIIEQLRRYGAGPSRSTRLG